jgi:cytochrome c553
VACHGVTGIAGAPQWPNLAGQHASYLRHALEQYRSGARADLVMAPLVGTLDAAALEELAAFYSAQPGLHVTEQ